MRRRLISDDPPASQNNMKACYDEVLVTRKGPPVRFTVGLRLNGRSEHTVVDAEDALIAALKVKADKPEAHITYVRRANRRGDARHPPHQMPEKAR
jgi:hypothetical protein